MSLFSLRYLDELYIYLYIYMAALDQTTPEPVVKPLNKFTYKDALANPQLLVAYDLVYKPTDLKLKGFFGDEDKIGISSEYDIQDSVGNKFKYFIRRIESPKTEEAYGPFLKELFNERTRISLWVILHEQKMKPARTLFQTYISTNNSKYEDSRLADCKQNDPMVIAKVAADAAAKKEADDKAEVDRLAAAAAKAAEDAKRKIEADAELKRINETEATGTVKTMAEISADDVLKAKSLFICEAYNSKLSEHKNVPEVEIFCVNDWMQTGKDSYGYATYSGDNYYIIIRKSSLFNRQELDAAVTAEDKKELFTKIILESSAQFVLDADDVASAKCVFLKHIKILRVEPKGIGQVFNYGFPYGHNKPVPVPTTDNRVKKNAAWNYIYMAIKRSSLASPPPQFPESGPVFKYVDDLVSADITQAVSIFVCQYESQFLDTIKKDGSVFSKPEIYDDKLQINIIVPPETSRSFRFVVRKSPFSDKDMLEIYNKSQIDSGNPVLTRDSEEFFKTVVNEPIKDGYTSPENIGWFVLDAKTVEDAFEAIKIRFNLTPTVGDPTTYTTNLRINDTTFTTNNVRDFLNKSKYYVKKIPPTIYVPPRPSARDDDTDTDTDEEEDNKPALPVTKQANKVAKIPQPTYTPQPTRPRGPLDPGASSLGNMGNVWGTGGNRRRTTRKKYKKSAKRVRRAKRATKRASAAKNRRTRHSQRK